MALIEKIQDLTARVRDSNGRVFDPIYTEVDEILLDITYENVWKLYYENDRLAAEAS